MGAMKEPEPIVPVLQVAASAIARDVRTGPKCRSDKTRWRCTAA